MYQDKINVNYHDTVSYTYPEHIEKNTYFRMNK